jgi:hypothetical protein
MLITSDLALAATLRLEGLRPDRMEIIDGSKACWVFSGEQADVVAEDYKSGECDVDPRKFALELRRTRDDLYAFLRERGVFPAQNRR